MTTEIVQAGDFVQSACAKCKLITKHIVVSLVAGVPSKVQCTLCKGNHAFRPKLDAATPKRAKAANRNPDVQDWLKDSPTWDENKAIPYAMAGVFRKGDLLRHSVFGLGMVRRPPYSNRMQVLFEVGEKLLVCGN